MQEGRWLILVFYWPCLPHSRHWLLMQVSKIECMLWRHIKGRGRFINLAGDMVPSSEHNVMVSKQDGIQGVQPRLHVLTCHA